MEYYDLQMAALNAGQSAAQTQLDSLRSQEAMMSAWKATYDSLVTQMRGYQTSVTNPQDAVERLALAKQAIEDVTGGMSTAAYIASLETTEEKQAAIELLRSLYDNYLSIGQEAYQRPSSEYQAIYLETIQELTALMEYMDSYASAEWDVQIDQLDALYAIRDEIRILEDLLNTTNTEPPHEYDTGDWIKDIGSGAFGKITQGMAGAFTGDYVLSDPYGIGYTGYVENGIMHFTESDGMEHLYTATSNIFEMFRNNLDLQRLWPQQYGFNWSDIGRFDQGGINTAAGTYYAGVPELHIPLENGFVPERFERKYDYPEMNGGGGDVSISFGDIHIDGAKDPNKTWQAFEGQAVKSIRSGKLRQAIQAERKGLN